jgi:O-antigen ligase
MATLYVAAGTFVVVGLQGLATGTLVPNEELGLSIFPPSDPTEVQSTYQTEGLYIGSFVVLSVCGACLSRCLVRRLVFGALTLAGFYLVLLIGSRATFIGTAVVVPGVLLWSAWKAGKARIMLLVPLAVMAAVLWVAGAAKLPHLEGLNTVGRLAEVLKPGDNDSTERGYLFATALELFLTDITTITFGAGMGEFDRVVGAVQGEGYPGVYYPHNVFLELLAEYGLVGATLYLAPMILLLAAHLRRPKGDRADPFRVACAAAMSLLWISNMGTGSLRLGWLLVFFTYVALALPPAPKAIAARAPTAPAPGSRRKLVPGLVSG